MRGHTLNIDLDFYHLKLRCFSAEETIVSLSPPKSFTGPQDPLQEGMATHSSILAWGIPWTAEPGGLQSTSLDEVYFALQ